MIGVKGGRNKAVSAKLDGCIPACKILERHKSSSVVLPVLDLSQSFWTSAAGSVAAGVTAQSAVSRGQVDSADSASENNIPAGELACAESLEAIRQCRPPSVRRKQY